MAAPHPARLPYVPALDGLRGVAVLAVLVFHDGAAWLGGGYLGVSTFFTLSGFLITSLLSIERAGGRLDLARFWERRLRRLMPAAFLGVVLAAALVAAAGSRSQVWGFRWDGLASLFYFANFRFMTAGHSYWEMFTRPSPLQHYWSLSIEEQFYFVYPLLLLGVGALARRGRDLTVTVVAGLAVLSTAIMIALSLAGAAPGRLYYGTDTRAAEFLIGALLATLIVEGGELRPWRGPGLRLATLAAAVFVVAAVVLVEQDSTFLYRGGFALYAVATAVLIDAALQPGVVQAVLAWRPLVFLGVVSYGVYVYHWPLFLWLDEQRTGLHGATLFLLRFAVTLAVAALSWLLVERPIRERRLLRGWWARLAAPAAATAVVALVLVVSANAPPLRRPHPRLAPMPALGAPYPGGPLRVLVLGDSVAFNVGSGLGAWATERGGPATVWNYAYYGCGVAHDTRKRLVNDKQRCAEWRDGWEVAIDRFRPDLVVILSGVWDLRDGEDAAGAKISPGDEPFDAWMLAEFQLAVDVASSRGARLLWLTSPCVGPVPRGEWLRTTGAMELERTEHLNRVLLPALVASRPQQVELLDVFARACPDGRFTEFDEQRRKLRSDYLHLSPSFAKEVAAAILQTALPSARADVAGTDGTAHAADR